MNDLGNFLQVALTVLTLASLAGLGLMRGTVTNLRENLKDARDEIADKDRRLKDVETEFATYKSESTGDMIKLNAKVNSQAHDIEAYGRLIRGESYWTELGDKLDTHHAEAKEHWDEDEKLLRRIDQRLDRLGGPPNPGKRS